MDAQQPETPAPAPARVDGDGPPPRATPPWLAPVAMAVPSLVMAVVAITAWARLPAPPPTTPIELELRDGRVLRTTLLEHDAATGILTVRDGLGREERLRPEAVASWRVLERQPPRGR